MDLIESGEYLSNSRILKHNIDNASTESSSQTPEEEVNEYDKHMRDCSTDFPEHLQLLALKFIHQKRVQYGKYKNNGIQYLQHHYQKTHPGIIMTDSDLKRLICIVIGKQNRDPERIVEFQYDEDIIDYCCCIPLNPSKSEHYRDLNEIIIRDGNEVVTFQLAYSVAYDYLKLNLGIVLNKVIATQSNGDQI